MMNGRVGAGFGLLFVLTALAGSAQPALIRFEFAEDHMGTRFRIVCFSRDEATATSAKRRAFQRIAELNDILSDYQPTSELMRLCQKAGGPPIPVSRDLFTVLENAERISKLTDGAFDATVGPMVRLWRRSRRTRELPLPERIAEAKPLVDYRLVELDESKRTVRLVKQNMLLDLGGISKGYTAEEAQKVLKQNGISSALVAAGGDIVVSDPPPDAKGWRIGITPLGEEAQDAPTMLLANCAISTAGDTEQFVEIGGVRYSHIVDPTTGIGLTNRIQVTVVADDGAMADGLDTGLAVLGPDRGIPIVDKLKNVSARFVWKKNAVLEERRSKRFPIFISASLRR
jgi:thiamine biosynthesis lipoprotein